MPLKRTPRASFIGGCNTDENGVAMGGAPGKLQQGWRQHIFTLNSFGLVVPVLLLWGATLEAEDWPQFLGPTRNGQYGGTILADSWPKAGPPLVWKKEVGQGFSGPVVANRKLILFHRVGNQERVECLDSSSGRPIWSYDYPTHYRDDFGFDEGPRATPAIDTGQVYTFGAEGMLHCLDLSTGRKIWDADTHQKFGVSKGFFGAACSPLVDGDRVLLNIGGTNHAGLVAFDRQNGKVLWTATDDEASYSSPLIVTMDGARHALFFTRSGLVDVDPAAGRVRFQFPWRARIRASVNAATPLVVGDLVFLSASYQTGAVLLQIKENQIKQLWSSDEVMSNHYATSVYHDGYLYGFHGRQEYGPSFRCVELKTGKVQWSRDHFKAGTVTLAGNTLLVLKEDGELVLAAASPKEFRPSARAQVLPGTVRSYPAVADGYLFARDQKTLVCVSLRK
jgi:outer membrane protein assembly factor BamB